MLDEYGFKNWGLEPLPLDSYDYEAEDKARRAEELQRKIAMRTGELQYENDGSLIHDSNSMIRAKEAANAVSRGADWLLEASENIADYGQGSSLDFAQFDAENEGKRYSMSNKDFISARNTTTKQLIDQYQNAKHDPNADKGVYTLKKFDGYNPDGSEKFLYKTGIAEVGANSRYNFKGIAQDIQDGYEIVEEKRFAGAEDWEKTWNASKGVLDARALDYGGTQTPDGKYASRDKASGVNFGDGYTEILNSDLLGVDEGKTQEDYDKNKEHSKRLTAMANARYEAGMSDSAVDALQSGIASLFVDTADFILDVFTVGDNTMLNDVKKKENIDRWVGYDRTQSTQALSDAATNWKNGNYFDAITGVLSDPNTMAESLPMMIGMVVGTGKFTAASRLLKATEKARQTGASVQHIAKLEDRARKLMTAKEITRYEKYQNSGTLLKTLDHFSKNAGYHVIVGAMTNNVLDDRIAEKIKAGEDPDVDMFEVAGVYATQLVLLSIDKMAFSKATGIGEGAGALKKAFKSLTKSEQKPIISKIVSKASAIAVAGGVEGVQEYAQTWGEILGANVGVSNKTVTDVLSDEDKQQEARMGALGGIGAGAQTRAIVETPGTLKDIKQAIDDKSYNTLSDNDLKFSNHSSDIQIADLKALNNEAMNRIQEIRTELKSAPDAAKTQELKDLIQTRKENVLHIEQRELTKSKVNTESNIKTDSDVDLYTTNVKGVTETSKVPGLKTISQGLNNRALTKELEKYSTEKLRKAVTTLNSKEPSGSNTKTLEMLNKVITKREKGESKVFSKNSTVEAIAKLETLTGKERLTTLTNILSNNTKLPDQEAFDKLKAIVDGVSDSTLLDGKSKEMYSKRLETIKSLGFGVDEQVEPDTIPTEEATEESKPTEPTDESTEENERSIEQPEQKEKKQPLKEMTEEEKLATVESVDTMSDEDYEGHYGKVDFKEFPEVTKVVSKIKHKAIKTLKKQLRNNLSKNYGHTKGLNKLKSDVQVTLIRDAIKTKIDKGTMSQENKDYLTTFIKSTDLSSKTKQSLVSTYKSKPSILGAIASKGVKFEQRTDDERFENKSIKKIDLGNVIGIPQKEKRLKQYVTKLVSDADFLDVFKSGAVSTDSTNKKALYNQNKSRRLNFKETKERDYLIEQVTASVNRGDFEEFKKDNKEDINKALRFATVALDSVIQSMRSTIDVTNDLSITDPKIKIDKLYAAKQDIQKEGGRVIEQSYGRNVVPKEGFGDLEVDQYYMDLMDIGLDLLIKAKIITPLTKSGSGTQIEHHAEQMIKSKVNEDQATEQEYKGKMLVDGQAYFLKGVSDNKDIEINSSLSSSNLTTPYDAFLNPIMRALAPSSRKEPTTERSTAPIRSDVNEKSEEHTKIYKDIRNKPVTINPKVFQAFLDVVDVVGHNPMSAVQTNIDTYWAKTMFDLHSTETSLEQDIVEVGGKVISKTANADAILDYIRSVESREELTKVGKKKLYHDYFSASNDRIHSLATAFNAQADKVVARYAQGVTSTTSSKEANIVLVTYLADILNVSGVDILSPGSDSNPDSKHKELNELVNILDKGGLKDLFSESRQTESKYAFMLKSGKSPMAIASALQGVIDVRNAVKDSSTTWTAAEITTHILVEMDASTSGTVNKLLNFLGMSLDDKQSARLFARIKRLTTPNESGEFGDAYLDLAEEVELQITKLESKVSPNEAHKKKVQIIKSVMAFVKRDKKGLRNLTKYPTMTNIYGQGLASLKKGLGVDTAKELIRILADKNLSTKDRTLAEAVVKALDIDVDPKDIEGGFIKATNALSVPIGSVMGQVFWDSLQELNSDLNRIQDKIVDSRYRALASARSLIREEKADAEKAKDTEKLSKFKGDYQISLRSVFDVVYNKLYKDADSAPVIDETGYVLEKLFKYSIDEGFEGARDVIPTKQEYGPNLIHASVVPLHAIDSAVLLLAYEATFNRLIGSKDPKGSLPIHDAVMASADFMVVFREEYEKATLDVAEHYDIVSEFDVSLEYAREQLIAIGISTSTATIANIDELLESSRKIQPRRLKLKKKHIDVFRAENSGFSIFGRDTTLLPEDGTALDTSGYESYSTQDFGVETSDEKTERRRDEAEKASQRGQKRIRRYKKQDRIEDFYGTEEEALNDYEALRELKDSGKPYVVIDTETSTESENASREIVEVFAVVMVGDKSISEHHLTMIPSNKKSYDRGIKSLNDKDGDAIFATSEDLLKAKGSTLSEDTMKEYTYVDAEGVTQTDFTRDQSKSDEAMSKFLEEMDLSVKNLDKDHYSENGVTLVGHNFVNFDDFVLRNTASEYQVKFYTVIDSMRAFKVYDDMRQESGAKALTNRKQNTMASEMGLEANTTEAHSARPDVIELANIVVEFANKTKDMASPKKEKKLTVIEQFQAAMKGDSKTRIEASKKVLNEFKKSKLDDETLGYIANIETYLNGNPEKMKVEKTKNTEPFTYNPNNDEIIISDEAFSDDSKGFFRYITHEIEHSVTANYLEVESNKEDKSSVEYKYIKRVYDKFIESTNPNSDKANLLGIAKMIGIRSKSTPDIIDQTLSSRVQYIMSSGETSSLKGLQEFVAIYRSNSDFRGLVSKHLFNEKDGQTIAAKIIKSIKAIVTKAMKIFTANESSELASSTLQHALENVIASSNVKPTEFKQKDSTILKETAEAMSKFLKDTLGALDASSSKNEGSHQASQFMQDLLAGYSDSTNLDAQIKDILEDC
jgi:hypothetical protein